MYTKPASIKTNIEKVDGQNVLRIDLSTFQASGTLENANHPNFIDGEFTVYPTMYGTYVDKIVLVGGYSSAEKKLIDKDF